MPTTYTDQFYIIDPFAPPAAGTVLTVNVYDLVDQNDNLLIEVGDGSTVNGVDVIRIYPGDTVTVTIGGVDVTFTGTTFYLANGIQVFTPTDGGVLETGIFVSSTFVVIQDDFPVGDLGPPCFTPGTMLETANGAKAVEAVQVGDLILTADKGLVPVLFCNKRQLSSAHLLENPKHRPIRIEKGALGDGLPSQDLTVSPQHRIMLRSKIALRMFGVTEVLVHAVHLQELPGVYRLEDAAEAIYIHVLLDHHAIIFAHGTPTETLYLGVLAREGFSRNEVAKISSNLPSNTMLDMVAARKFLRGKETKKLVLRHLKNAKPVIATSTEVRVAAQVVNV